MRGACAGVCTSTCKALCFVDTRITVLRKIVDSDTDYRHWQNKSEIKNSKNVVSLKVTLFVSGQPTI